MVPPPFVSYSAEDMQRRQDDDHLRILAICYYVMAGLSGFTALYFLMYAFMGSIFAFIPASQSGSGGPMPAFMSSIFAVIGGFGVVVSAVKAFFDVRAGLCLARKQGYTLPFVMAVITCLSVPIGTLLGVFTIVVLTRPSVKYAFGQGPAPQYPTPPSSTPPPSTPENTWYRGPQ